jgi:hypothetical protein
MAHEKKRRAPTERTRLPAKTQLMLLTEAGYKCGVPTCRNILALDMHHIYEVSEGGSNDPLNLIVICSFCHDLYHRGVIKRESLYVYKSMLVAIAGAFDVLTIDQLLFLEPRAKDFLVVSGDGLLRFARLIAANLASAELKVNNNFQLVTYVVNITTKGRMVVQAWREGNRARLEQALAMNAAT